LLDTAKKIDGAWVGVLETTNEGSPSSGINIWHIPLNISR